MILPVGGKHILLNRCIASPKCARWRKSQNRVVTIGDSMLFNIRRDAGGCYVCIWKCRNRLLTIGKETIFEYSAWQPMRVQKSTIYTNIAISIDGSTISEICQGSMGCYVRISKCFPPLVRRRFLNIQHGSPCGCRNRRFSKIFAISIGGSTIS